MSLIFQLFMRVQAQDMRVANKSPYAFSKYKGEELCKLYNQLYGLKTYVCRFYNVYGNHQIEKVNIQL